MERQSLPMNNETHSENHGPHVEVVISRPAYRLGGTVVGTVRLVSSQSAANARSFFESAQVYVAGRCRIDARWHNAELYKQLYGSHPLLDSVMDERVEVRVLEAQKQDSRDGRTVCFWATNVVDLLELEERQVGRWQDVKPQPLKTRGSSWAKFGTDEMTDTPSEHEEEQSWDGTEPLERRQLAFTFRVELPLDIAPTITATCCRYFYSAVVCAKSAHGELFVVQAPFTVLSPLEGIPTEEPLALAGRVKLGTCLAVAHSVGLPCHISATELHRPTGQVTVNRHVGLLSASHDVQTLRVADQNGTLCCVLTVMGAKIMSPGSRLLLQFDFPKDRQGQDDEHGETASKWLPCYQVSASLEGEELVVNEDGTRHRARAYLFGGEHELVESGYTDRVSLSLCLPLDCPYTIQTDLVKIDVWCKVELTIDQSDGMGYSTLRLDLPVHVVHSPTADEMETDDADDMSRVVSLEELVLGKGAIEDSDNQAPPKFKTNDIMNDLKVLSMLMIDNSGLRQEVVSS